MNLMAASTQWANRPEDERFFAIDELHANLQNQRHWARERTTDAGDLSIVANGGQLKLVDASAYGNEPSLNHWSLGQLCRIIGAPAEYIRTLPASLAAQNLSDGLQRNLASDKPVMLFTGEHELRALTSERYTRIYDLDVVSWVRDNALEEQGWRVPPARPVYGQQHGTRPATEADVLANRNGQGGLSINIGDLIAPAGLYASDHDVFMFMVNEQIRIEDGSAGGLSRGFFISNSETGAACFNVTRFLYRTVCGNHIVWGAKQVEQIRLRHVGSADVRAFDGLRGQIGVYAQGSAVQEQQLIQAAQQLKLAAAPEQMIDFLFNRRLLSRKLAEKAFALVDPDQHEDPYTSWGIAQGVTRLSQQSQYADQRVAMDGVATQILELAS